jgi:hypothetical protein
MEGTAGHVKLNAWCGNPRAAPPSAGPAGRAARINRKTTATVAAIQARALISGVRAVAWSSAA